MEYKTNNNIIYSCKYHIVWCPKYRRKVLTGRIAIRLRILIDELCNNMNIDIIEMEIMPDHIHMLIEINPQFPVHKAIKQIKGHTSRILRNEFKELRTKIPTLWTNSYFISTVGSMSLEAVKQYIQSQETSQRK